MNFWDTNNHKFLYKMEWPYSEQILLVCSEENWSNEQEVHLTAYAELFSFICFSLCHEARRNYKVVVMQVTVHLCS
jgi:hypothetical protein